MNRSIQYIFTFEDNSSLDYKVEFNDHHDFIPASGHTPGDWALLENNKCKNCPLNSVEYKYCPVARNVDEIVQETKNKVSYEKASVEVITSERTYTKDCDTQEGLLSLFGLIMPTSGCPHLSWFKPLTRFHLPFSTIDETLYRVLSMQLLSSYLESSEESKFDINDIKKKYSEIEIVNLDFIDRIRTQAKADADVNAVAALDVFAKLFDFERETNFEGLRAIFGLEVNTGTKLLDF